MPMLTTTYTAPPAHSPEYIDLFLYLFIFSILYEYLILKSESVREKKYIQTCHVESSQFWIQQVGVMLGTCSKIFCNASTKFSWTHSEWEGV